MFWAERGWGAGSIFFTSPVALYLEDPGRCMPASMAMISVGSDPRSSPVCMIHASITIKGASSCLPWIIFIHIWSIPE